MSIVLYFTQFGDVCKTVCLPIVLALQKVGNIHIKHIPIYVQTFEVGDQSTTFRKVDNI
jgi:hypothetical protein